MTYRVRSVEELFAAQASAAVAISGADHSSWSGRTGVVAQQEGVSCTYGLAYWNGDIAYDDTTRATLREMFDTAGQQHDFATLVRFRHALRVVLHENSHMLARPNTEWEHGRDEYQTAAGKALEEGVTEGWSFDNLSRYITELGIDEIAPGINDVEGVRLYPQYHPATAKLCEGIGEFTGRTGAEVLTELNNASARDKWLTAVGMLWEHSGMPDRFAGRDAEETRAEFAAELRNEFGNLKNLEGRGYDAQVQASREAGQRAVATVVKRIRKLEAAVPPRAAQPNGIVKLWTSGTTPLRQVGPPRLGQGAAGTTRRGTGHGAVRGGHHPGQHRD